MTPCLWSRANRPSGRRRAAPSVGVRVGRGAGAVMVGGGAPIAVQSMTNTDTADVEATARQVAALARAGSEFVRITVDRDEAAAAVPHIRDRLAAMGVERPAGRRLPLHRPQIARASIPPAPRRSTNTASIPATSASGISATRSSADRRDRDAQRQMRAHRRQLGLARPGTADRADGRQRGSSRGRSRRAR